MPNGYLRCDGRLTKVGVFPYRQPDGSVRRELRLPADVFDAESMSSFGLVPLTNNHPTEMLNSHNTRKHQVGSVISPRADDEFIAASVLVTDAGAISDIEKGKRELSCGYNCDLEFDPGVTSGIPGVRDGLKYDAIQKNIRGNHVAIVSKGKAGLEAALRLDADDAVLVTDELSTGAGSAPPKSGKVNKMRLDGVDYEMSDQAEQAVGLALEKRDKEIVTLTAKTGEATTALSKETARADVLDEEKTALQTKLDEASDPATVQTKVDERVTLISQAKPMVAKEDQAKLDTMTDAEIRRAVVESRVPEGFDVKRLDDEVYVAQRFEFDVEKFDVEAAAAPSPSRKGFESVRRATARVDAGDKGQGSGGGGGGERTHMDARQEMIKKNAEVVPIGRAAQAAAAK